MARGMSVLCVCGMWVGADDARCDEVGKCVAGYMDLEQMVVWVDVMLG